MTMSPSIIEERRFAVTVALASVGWLGAIIFTVLTVSQTTPRPIGTVVILFVGVAIASTLSLSRMRLTNTITRVFEAGLSASVVLQANSASDVRTCVIETDVDGIITTAQNPEVVGWHRGELEGQPLKDLIPVTSHPVLAERFNMFRLGEGSPTPPLLGPTVTLPLLGHDGRERAMRVTIARLGDMLVATLSPAREQRGQGSS